MKYICALALFCVANSWGMHRSLSSAELEAAKIALSTQGISYDRSMPTIKKPMMRLVEVDVNNTKYLIDVQAQMVLNTYTIAQRPATC